MFEDSTFESYGRIHTRSRAWMLATCVFNGSILLAMVLIPLMYPSALPNLRMSFPMAVPMFRSEEPKSVTRVATVATVPSQIDASGRITAPTRIPDKTFIPENQEVTRPVTVASADFGGDGTNASSIFSTQGHRTEVHPATTGPVRISTLVSEGLLIRKILPVYPPIAVATRQEGTVILQATISRSGTIENLHVVSGPMMLQQAAVNAVQQWRYRPYLLSGEPVEVETTVNVVFKLN